MLSESALREFSDRGYTVIPTVFGARDVARMRLAFKRLERRAHQVEGRSLVDGSLFVTEKTPEGRLKIERIVWCGGAEPVLARLGRERTVVAAAAELLGTTVVDQLINQAHIKNPGDGVRFHFHQDSYHRRYGTELFTDVNGRGSFVQTLTAIDPMTADNGGLFVVPGSHLGGHIPTLDGRLPEGSFDRRAARAGRHAAALPLHHPRQRSEPRAHATSRVHQRFRLSGREPPRLPGCGVRRAHHRLERRGLTVRPRALATHAQWTVSCPLILRPQQTTRPASFTVQVL
jgi:ectoine hydroxylase-related dioxygenase (phytanoyl-CoA dioxygenase family)